MSVSADQRNSLRITEDVMLACLLLPDDAELTKPLFEPCEGYEMEARLEELDQGHRECHAHFARCERHWIRIRSATAGRSDPGATCGPRC
jgi:hypothetical protein